ncbi:hypothetical protein SMSP2_02503 [Limihaloglobus sulfuriphilus]|uniref:Uncharacterized protein n=1 Tax=Limihaloglobus sulfuriphilus TaxID=1851148 RepID=A0A1Q2MIP1_9BACT|nr:hypothetical protein SMSP2_02503 [Limihaloglobus sulfuriphilus]
MNIMPNKNQKLLVICHYKCIIAYDLDGMYCSMEFVNE